MSEKRYRHLISEVYYNSKSIRSAMIRGKENWSMKHQTKCWQVVLNVSKDQQIPIIKPNKIFVIMRWFLHRARSKQISIWWMYY